jgi:pentatricopeptide repeat protein
VWASAISACGKAGKPDLALATLKDYRLGMCAQDERDIFVSGACAVSESKYEKLFFGL